MPTIFLNKNQYASNGGKELTLTQTQYDVLSEQEKMNGTTYYILDANSDKEGGFQPVIYNMNEREIGVWCDGKPLYQKTINFGALPNNTSKLIAHNISNLDTVVNCSGTSYASSTGSVISIPFVHRSNISNQVQLGIDSTNIMIYTAANQTAYSSTYITIQYTKTTDAPGSGSWTPDGIPAKHYSTEEHVVGTWYDGSIIYERTVEITNSFSSSYPYDISSFSNGILDFEGYYICTTNNGTYRIPLNYYEDGTYHTYTGYNVTTNKMFLKVYGFTGQKAILTIRYTKAS